MSSGQFAYTPTLKNLYYGPGVLKTALPNLLEQLGGKKALIITGNSLRNKTDVIKQVQAILEEHNAYGATFSDIGEHAPIAGIKEAQKTFEENGCDIIVSVGGGSPIDSSKTISHYIREARKADDPLPHIAIPTTLSASEYTYMAGHKDENGNKTGVTSPDIAPSAIILDAELTKATPEKLWLSTGIRALDHAVEALYRPNLPIPLKYLAYAAIKDLFKYLPISKANPGDIEARQRLQVAAWMSLFPIKMDKMTPLGLSHHLGHALGAKYSIPHGITSCITLAPVVGLKAEFGSQDDKEWLSGALAYLDLTPTGNLEKDVVTLSDSIQRLVDGLGLKTTLTEYKVPKGDLQGIAEHAGEKEDLPIAKVLEALESVY